MAVLAAILLPACGDEIPTEPSVDSSEAVFASSKPSVGLTVDCWGCFLVDGNSYYTDETAVDLFYDVCPAERGSIRVYGCYDDSGEITPASFCVNGTYRWDELKKFRKRVYPTECWNPLFNTTGTTAGEGWLVKYKAQGSGYLNEEYSFTVYFVPSGT